jgi:gamma-glutamyltranspeptidase/glutathione hydrolase
MVTAPHHLASQAGLEVLRDGGSAVEACVTVAATLGSVYPHMSGIGGDGFWLIAEPDGSVRAIDACGPAGSKVALSLYAGRTSVPWRGPLAANTMAGTVAGWHEALQSDHGRLPLSRLLRDAIQYAEHGVVVTAGGAEIAATKGSELRGLPGSYATTFEPNGRPLREGELIRQPVLAQTLRSLSEHGLRSFYSGAIAEAIASDLSDLGSPISATDLERHKATCVAPLSVATSDAQLFNMPPPTQGLVSLLILALFDRLGVRQADSFEHLHGLIEATKQAFLVRDKHVGDPAYMELDPQRLLDDRSALDQMATRINPMRALPWPHAGGQGDTTWFGAADGAGQLVSCIQSTYFEFGSGLVLPRTGIVWQNRGASFRLAESGWNALRPGRKPFHTLNPALAKFADGRVMVYGTMGGDGQPQTQAAVFTRYASLGVPLQAAITAPRWLLGRTWGEEVTLLRLEGRFSASLVDALKRAGHRLQVIEPYSSVMGHAGAIVRHASGLLEGASDPRSDGGVAAW